MTKKVKIERKPMKVKRTRKISEEQTGSLRCCASLSRIPFGVCPVFTSVRVGTLGGGDGGGVPNILSKSHLPRSTGEVRPGYEVTVSKAP